MSESNNKTTETESQRSKHHKYRQVLEKLWPWLYLNENKMCISDGERFLLNGPMALSSKFQWAIS
jgi:hypothetical protein